MKKIIIRFPEYYLALLIILSGFTPPFSFHPLIVAMVCIPILQIVFKNKVSGLIIAALFLFVNLFMLGALISETSEFVKFTSDTRKLLLGGLSIWSFNMFAVGVMFYKYMKADQEKTLIQFRTQKA